MHAAHHNATAKQMQLLISLPLNDLEQGYLDAYCKADDNTAAVDWLVIYYLQRCNYARAFELHEQNVVEQLQQINTALQPATRDPRVLKARGSIIDQYRKLLPDCYISPVPTTAVASTTTMQQQARTSNDSATSLPAKTATRHAPQARIRIVGKPATLATRSRRTGTPTYTRPSIDR
jgi:hypothetical protein